MNTIIIDMLRYDTKALLELSKIDTTDPRSQALKRSIGMRSSGMLRDKRWRQLAYLNGTGVIDWDNENTLAPRLHSKVNVMSSIALSERANLEHCVDSFIRRYGKEIVELKCSELDKWEIVRRVINRIHEHREAVQQETV